MEVDLKKHGFVVVELRFPVLIFLYWAKFNKSIVWDKIEQGSFRRSIDVFSVK